MTDLSAPLSRRRARQEKANEGRSARRLPIARTAFALLGVIGAGVVATVLLVDTPEGGRPSATVAINSTVNANAVAGAVSDGTSLPATITADPEMIAVPDAQGQSDVLMDVALADPAGISPDLVEETEFGQIPRISSTGVTPFAAYSRGSASLAEADGKPMVAIVVSGLGINPNGTLEAIEKLPAEVTLAFAPYGKGLQRSVASARTSGHEVLLEVPLEPFDYPDNDPGPETLLTGQAPRDNLNKLFQVMSRFGGYVGLLNNMGARFTASGADFGPVMEELGARGLGYLDDGSSNRSLAPQLARANRVPFARVDAMVDTNPSRAAILAQLQALEDKARRNGSAIGIVSALPVSIEVVTEWARGMADKGIVIVPASALMGTTDG
jgi:polysaccharide deacetylase 2 family uncharacterized protein YibQ